MSESEIEETMANDADYAPPDGEDSCSSGINLRPHIRTADGEVVRRESPRNKARSPPQAAAPRLGLPTSLKAVNPRLKSIQQRLRSQPCDDNLSLRVIHAALTLQKEHLEHVRKLGKDRKKAPTPRVRERVCDLFGMSPGTYTKVMRAYLGEKKLYETGDRGNYSPKKTRVPRTKQVLCEVREFVRECRRDRRRVTARQVLDFLYDKRYITIKKDDNDMYEKKSLATAYRNVRQYLQKQNYRRGRRTGNLGLKPNQILLRDQYLKAFMDNRALPVSERKREVYMDESYIHEHYNRNDDSLWDPNDEMDIQYGKAKNKGRRYCFIAAIQGPSPDGKEEAGLVPNSVWRFCPQKKSDSRGDYHKVFNSSNFVAWWRDQLLPNLTHPSIIYMDNAKYHKTYDASVPKVYRMNKAPLIAWLQSVDVECDERDTMVILKAKAKKYITECCVYECVQLAEAQGHTVVFTPPYYSDLQPIELVWARIKGNVGRQYSIHTTLSMVLERLDREFDILLNSGSSSIQGMINKCAERTEKLYKEADLGREDVEPTTKEQDGDESESSEQSDEDESDEGNTDAEDDQDDDDEDEEIVAV